MNLGLKLFAAANKQSKSRSVITILSIAIASGLLFATLAGISAIGRQEDRAVWVRDVFSRDTIRDASGEKGTHFLAFYEHYISGELYWVAEVKEAANQPALMPGVSSIPEDGQFYASPALIKLMKQLPDDQLRDRLPEQLLGEIEPEGLTGPGQLLAVVGSSADTAGVESVVQFTTEAPLMFGIIQIIIIIGAFTVLIPVVLFVANSSKVGAHLRQQRYAALRLAGASRSQITKIWLIETGILTTTGIILGYSGYLLSLPLLTGFSFYSGGFYISDLILEPHVALGIGAIILGLFLLSTWWAARSISISPLGIRQKTVVRIPRFWRVIPLILLSGGLALITIFLKENGEVLTFAFIGFMVGLSISLLLAGPYLTRIAALIVSRFSKQVEVVIASKYIATHATQTFRTISGVVVLIFASSLYFVLSGSFNDVNRIGLPGTLQQNMVAIGASIPEEEAEAVMELTSSDLEKMQTEITAIEGVTSLYPVYITTEITSESMPWTHVIDCDSAAQLSIGECEDESNFAVVNYSNFMFGQPTDIISEAKVDSKFISGLIVETDKSHEAMNRLQTHLINITSQPENPIYFIDQSDTIMTVTMFSNLDALAYLGLSVTILVSGLNLLVSTSNSIMNRKHSFYLLRLAGTPLSLLKKTIMIEALTPLLATILLSALVGAGFGIAFLQMLINQGAGAYGYKIVAPEPTYYIFIVGSVALCVLLVISTFSTLDKTTSLESNRQE